MHVAHLRIECKCREQEVDGFIEPAEGALRSGEVQHDLGVIGAQFPCGLELTHGRDMLA